MNWREEKTWILSTSLNPTGTGRICDVAALRLL